MSAAEDQRARERIRDDLDSTLFVEAGAGTGKTTALVGRIVALVSTGRARLRNIAAITFTEAAASELRDRVREELEKVAATDDPPRSTRAAEAVAELDAAAISTLHGFAQRLLATYPFEAGLPPVFEVLDEIRSAVAFDERWRAFVDELLDDDELRPAVQRALVAEVRLDQLRTIASELDRNWDLLVDRPPTAAPLEPVSARTALAALSDALDLRPMCRADDDKLAAHLDGLVQVADALRGAESELEVLELLAGSDRWSAGRAGRQENWGGYVDEVRGALERAQAARVREAEQARRGALAHLLVALSRLTLEGAGARRRDGGLEFHDLLVQARQLLRDHPELVADLHSTYTHLLIDEFQDTDPIQLELAVRIATGRADTGPWRSWTPPAGRLFFVGDPKQSIYRFRRADVATYLDTRSTYADDPVVLTRNHRSVPGIVDWVNDTFGRLMVARAGSQPEHLALDAHRAAHAGAELPVVVLGGAVDDARVAEVRAAEAGEIARTIARARDEGWPVGSDATPARLADVCVLLPTRTALPALERALDEAHLPYRVESSSLVYGSAEVRDLLNVLRAVDDPSDERAVVAALRSPWFGCGDDDLLEFRIAGGRWNPVRPGADSLAQDHPVLDGLRSLRELHQRRWWHDASSLVEQVLVERRAFELGLDERRPRDVWRRLQFVVDQARAFTDAYGTDLRRYLAWAELQSAEDARVVETVLPESDDDAVRIMTVHAAKGLEFPIVVLAGLGTEDRSQSGVDVVWGPAGPEVKLVKGSASAGYDEIAGIEAERQADEQIRLLYVAATRARDHLVVSLHHKAGLPCHAARLAPVCAEISNRWRTLDTLERDEALPADPGDRGVLPTDAEREAERAERADWIARRTTRLAESRPRVVAATGVRHLAAASPPSTSDPTDVPAAEIDEARVEEPAAIDAEPTPSRRGRGGTAVGRAVHGVLQVVDLATGSGLDELAAAQATAEGVATRAGQVARLARAALASEVVRQAVSGRCWRELYVGVPVGPRVLEGFVDLLVETPTGLTVIDYKTDAVSDDDDLDHAVARYRLQGAAYAVAVEEALGRPVDRCVLLFLRPSGAVERALADLDGAKADVRRALAS